MCDVCDGWLSLIWSSTWLFIKLGLEDLPPVTFAGVRFVVASLALGAFVAVARRPLPRARREWGLIALTGVMAFSLNYGLLFWGEKYVSSGLAALLQTSIPVFGLVIGHLHLPNERMTRRKVAGVLIGIAGVAFILTHQKEENGAAALWGGAAIVLGAFCVAYANVLIKARGARIDPAAMALGQMVCGFVPLLLFGAAFEGNPLKLRWTPLAIVCLLYLSLVGSALAFLLFYWLVRNMDVTKTMLIPLVTPVIALTLGAIFLHEALTWRVAAGGAAVLCGIALIVRRKAELTEDAGGEAPA
ncbi:MAG: EamA family transporter [Acidobacteria bacterium]|nr:EamA family transporter [Acidobacteriota bacterium]